jgi:hypothetical protein
MARDGMKQASIRMGPRLLHLEGQGQGQARGPGSLAGTDENRPTTASP